jgi:hypothetical protein
LLLAIELFIRGRWCRRGVGRRVLRMRPASRRCSLRSGRLPHLRWSERRRLRLRRRSPTRGGLRWCAVRRTLPRRAIARRRTDGCAERIQPFRRARLVAWRLTRRKWRGRLRRRRTPGCGWRGGPGRRRGRLVPSPLRWVGLRRCRRVLRCSRCCWRRVLRRGAPLRGGTTRRHRRDRGWRILRRCGRWRWRRRARCCCRGQRGAAREAKLAGGLVGGATPRADDHESDSRELRAPVTLGPGPRQQNQGGGSLRGRSIPGFASKGAKSLGVHRPLYDGQDTRGSTPSRPEPA